MPTSLSGALIRLEERRNAALAAGNLPLALSLAQEISNTPAATIEGVAVKARLLADLEEPETMPPEYIARRLILAIVDELGMLTGTGALLWASTPKVAAAWVLIGIF